MSDNLQTKPLAEELVNSLYQDLKGELCDKIAQIKSFEICSKRFKYVNKVTAHKVLDGLIDMIKKKSPPDEVYIIENEIYILNATPQFKETSIPDEYKFQKEINTDDCYLRITYNVVSLRDKIYPDIHNSMCKMIHDLKTSQSKQSYVESSWVNDTKYYWHPNKKQEIKLILKEIISSLFKIYPDVTFNVVFGYCGYNIVATWW